MIRDEICERLVIGTFLTYSKTIAQAREYLTPNSFTDWKLSEMYTVITDLEDRGEGIDIVSVTAELLKRKSRILPDDVLDVSNKVDFVSLDSKVLRLRDLEIRRKLEAIGDRCKEASADESVPIEEIIERVRSYGKELETETSTDDLEHVYAEVKERMAQNFREGDKQGSRTGFSFIDKSGGIHPSDLVIVAGSTSHGKTSFALSVTMNAIKNGKKIVFYSLEMRKVELGARIIAMNSGVPSSLILYGKPDTGQIQQINGAIEKTATRDLMFDDKSTSSIESIISSIRAMRARHDIDGAVIDYLQILSVNSGSKESEEQRIAAVARRLKNLAKDLNIWIMALSQLNRQSGESKQPTLDRLRSSGQIAEAADTVILVYRPEIYDTSYSEKEFKGKETHNTALIDVAKGRNTGTGKFLCRFCPEMTLFEEADYIPDKGEEPAVRIDPWDKSNDDSAKPF